MLGFARVDRGVGRIDEAREGYERVVGLARARDRRQVEVVAAIELAWLESDAGRIEAARAQAERAVAAAERLGNPHFLASALLTRAMTALLADDIAGADAAIRQADLRQAVEASPVLWRTVAAMVASATGRPDPALDAELDAAVFERLGPDAADVRALTLAGRSGATEPLVSVLSASPRRSIELRLLARVWLAAIGGRGRPR
jgi:hypothetical protein